jgi:hypothetical protein
MKCCLLIFRIPALFCRLTSLPSLPPSLSPLRSLLILNAGVAEKEHPNVNASQLERKELMEMFDVNVCGTASIMKHMLPLVLESHEKKVIGVTTKMASLEEATTDKPYISAGYRITKAAENMREFFGGQGRGEGGRGWENVMCVGVFLLIFQFTFPPSLPPFPPPQSSVSGPAITPPRTSPSSSSTPGTSRRKWGRPVGERLLCRWRRECSSLCRM